MEHKKIEHKESSKIIRLIRRYFFYYFRRKEMIRRYNELTKGKACHMCGCCANKVSKCKYFVKGKNLCLLWKKKKMPLLCMITPFDAKDATDYILKNCAFFGGTGKNCPSHAQNKPKKSKAKKKKIRKEKTSKKPEKQETKKIRLSQLTK